MEAVSVERQLLERRVQALLTLHPTLTAADDLREAILAALYAAPAPTRPIVLPIRRARDKLRRGVPLLHGENVFLDDGFIRDVFGQLVNLLRAGPDTAERAADVARAVHEHRLHVEHAVAEAFVNHPEHLDQVALEAGVSPELLAMLAQLSARPVLTAYAEHLAPALDAGREDWTRGYCPVCGAWPGLDEQRGADQLRHLRCLRCETAWLAAVDREDAVGGDGRQRSAQPGFRLELVDGEDDFDDD